MAADEQQHALHQQQEEDGVRSKSPSAGAATASPGRRGPTPFTPASTVNLWGTEMGKGVKAPSTWTRRRVKG